MLFIAASCVGTVNGIATIVRSHESSITPESIVKLFKNIEKDSTGFVVVSGLTETLTATFDSFHSSGNPQLFVSVYKIISQLSAFGVEYKAYLPFFSSLPAIFTSSLKEIVVFALAPVLQCFPKGTRSP